MTDTDTDSDSPAARPVGEDAAEYDPSTDTFHVQIERVSSTAVVVTIVDAVATVTNRDPAALSPLFATVDPEALADLLASAEETPADVRFSYEGCRVTVSSGGTIVVEPPPE